MRNTVVLATVLVIAISMTAVKGWGQETDDNDKLSVAALKNLHIGCMGKQIGTKLSIKCKLAISNHGNSQDTKKCNGSRLTKDCPHCPQMVKIISAENVPLSEELEIAIINAPKMQEDVIYTFEGYESGEFSGQPEWVEKYQIVYPLLHYRPVFLVTKDLSTKQK
jgi:hypothetical protein